MHSNVYSNTIYDPGYGSNPNVHQQMNGYVYMQNEILLSCKKNDTAI